MADVLARPPMQRQRSTTTSAQRSLFEAITASASRAALDVDGLESDVIERGGEPYMERYYLLGSPAVGGSTMRYHHIVASDSDVMHDHPWDFVSVILSGSYVESTPHYEHEHGPGSVLVRRAEQLHRLTLVDGPVWTLVALGPVRRRWGFMTPTGWVHWSEFPSARA